MNFPCRMTGKRLVIGEADLMDKYRISRLVSSQVHRKWGFWQVCGRDAGTQIWFKVGQGGPAAGEQIRYRIGCSCEVRF